MSYTGLQRALLKKADEYERLGYKIGLASGKALAASYQSPSIFASPFGAVQHQGSDDWDGLSIILDGLVCVDFDTMHMDLGTEYPLPPTLKEKSNRGYHLFYRLPDKGYKWEPKIKWKPDVDLLVNVNGSKKRTAYADDPSPFGGHVICSPTPGYTRVWPDETPHKNKLTMAPDWLIDELAD